MRLLVVLAVILMAPQGLAACDRRPLFVSNVAVFTPRGIVARQDVLVRNGVIESVVAHGRAAAPTDARIVDGTGHTLLPGLIDAHAHFFELGSASTSERFFDPPAAAFDVTGPQLLRSGVTTARVHLFDLVDGPAFRDRSKDDCHPAPRLEIGGPGFMGGAPDLNSRQMYGAKSADDIREKIARIAAAGVRWVALHDLEKFEPGQLETIVAEARKANLRVMAQGNSAAEAARALALGVDSIEYLDRTPAPSYPKDLVAKLAASRVAVVPPIGYYHRYQRYRTDPTAVEDRRALEFVPPAIAEKVLASLREGRTKPPPSWAATGEIFETLGAKFRQLRRGGVHLVVGTDAGSPTQFHTDAIWWELETWRRLGAPPLEAIEAATTRGAALLADPSIGRIEPGARGDLVLFKGDVRRGPLTLDRVLMVAKDGVVFVSNGAWADPAREATAAKLRDTALTDPTAYSIVSDLTTLFGPRPAGSEAEKKAAAWCAETMKTIGLANVRIEEFPLTEWRRGIEQGEIVGTGAQSLVVTALGGTSPTPEGGVEGEVVLFPTLDALRAASPDSLQGKIAMINYRMPRLESGLGYDVATRGRGEGPGEAAARGAIAFLLRSAGTNQHRLPHTGATRFKDGRVPIPAFALSAADADQIERLATKGPVRVRLSSTAQVVPGGTSRNIIGEIPGARADEIILIGAHLDSWDLGTGAVDDGAGVGIVLAAARLIAAMPVKPRRTIRVVLFGAEEVSQPAAPFFLAGGNAYAAAHKDELQKYVIASEADLGAGRVIGLDLPAGWANSDLAATLGRVLLPLGVLVEAEVAPHGGADFFPLQLLGVPVFLLKQDATQYFDLHHTADDTLDKIDPAELRQVVAAWAATLWLISESESDFRAGAQTAR